MARLPKKELPGPSMPIAAMIDMVFLLLIYFMVSASLQPQEADIAFQLPGVVEQDEPLEMPDEQIIEINARGQVILNEYRYDSPDAARFSQLARTLGRYREACDVNKVEAIISIAPDDAVSHQTIVKVMDACSFAGIENLNFAIGGEGLGVTLN